MTGLHVYGALMMALSFTVGVLAHSPLVILLSLVAAATAALGEALIEVDRALSLPDGVRKIAGFVAPLSWLAAAVAGLSAVLVLI